MNPEPLLVLFANQSAESAEATVCRALEDIAGRLDRLQLARTAGSYEEIASPARRIATVARGLGLTGVQEAATHVSCAADSMCGVAVGATMARLERCFDQAVTSVWDYRMYC